MIQPLTIAQSFLEGVTLGQVLICLSFFASVVAAVRQVKNLLHEWMTAQLRPEFDAINQRLDEIEKRSERQDLENCKNYLVLFLADIERNEKVDEVEIARFHEQYEYYTKKGGNSYIHRKYEKLKGEGKL